MEEEVEEEKKEECMDLLKKMLNINGRKRISCEEALQHPYFD